MKDSQVVILGGGLAGLTASLYCGAPVYEAAPSAGGVAASDKVDGFTFDRGIHVLQTDNDIVQGLLGEKGVSLGRRSRQAYIYSHRTFTPYPFQVNTAGLPIGLRARCLASYFQRERNPEPKNYREWMYRNIGKGFADTFLIPYSQKFWTVDPAEMTFDWTGNRVPQPRTRQVIRGAVISKQTRVGTNASFEYPENNDCHGYGAIPAALARSLDNVHTDCRAVDIDVDEKLITFANGRKITYQRLISTIPLPELVKICRQAPDAVVAAAGKLRTNSIFVVNLGIAREHISDHHWVHFPEKDISCFRLSFPHNLASGTTPEGMSSVSAEVAYDATDSVPDAGEVTARVIRDLTRVGILRENEDIPIKATHDIRYGYCIYDFARKDAVQTIHQWLRENDIIPSGRYAMWAYFWSHEAMLSGRKAAEIAMRDEGPDEVDGAKQLLDRVGS